MLSVLVLAEVVLSMEAVEDGAAEVEEAAADAEEVSDVSEVVVASTLAVVFAVVAVVLTLVAFVLVSALFLKSSRSSAPVSGRHACARNRIASTSAAIVEHPAPRKHC